MKSGVSVFFCPNCDDMEPHHLAIVGQQIFAACHHCHTVSVMEEEAASPVMARFVPDEAPRIVH